jgi:hypothetical protein
LGIHNSKLIVAGSTQEELTEMLLGAAAPHLSLDTVPKRGREGGREGGKERLGQGKGVGNETRESRTLLEWRGGQG